MSRQMRRMALGSLVAAMALAGIFSSSAVAASTHASRAAGAAARPTKVKTTKVKYEATYTDEKFGPVHCKGVHITSAAFPGTATTGGEDKFKCKSTTGKPVTYGNPGEKLPENFTEWASDYFNNMGHFVLAKSLNVTISGSGKSYKGVAIYPSPEEEAAQKEKAEREQKEKEEKEQAEKEAKEKAEKEQAEKELKENEENEKEEP